MKKIILITGIFFGLVSFNTVAHACTSYENITASSFERGLVNYTAVAESAAEGGGGPEAKVHVTEIGFREVWVNGSKQTCVAMKSVGEFRTPAFFFGGGKLLISAANRAQQLDYHLSYGDNAGRNSSKLSKP